ncbi:MAG TPA: hypothetical protein VNQ97_14805 [Burkholderiaceae bacterium]|nr:hypothetical protein [Burkholderiaceae bacterium]
MEDSFQFMPAAGPLSMGDSKLHSRGTRKSVSFDYTTNSSVSTHTAHVMPADHTVPDWTFAPPGWDWTAQDEDGRWFWYGVKPVPGIGGGVWRAPSRAQMLAAQGEPNPEWYATLAKRPTLQGTTE